MNPSQQGAFVFLISESNEQGDVTPVFFPLDKEALQNLYSAIAEGSLLLPFGDDYLSINDIIKFKIIKGDDKPFRIV